MYMMFFFQKCIYVNENVCEFGLKFRCLFLTVQLIVPSIDSDNGFSSTRRRAIIWTNDEHVIDA